ncbi:ABC transporter ATP-binding protein [Leucobacter sp. M11]|uniref:ABC transporter ATP-binding protein n=1 Tax=Leucobacter sp. M11 TaxID=2993565 RepID=UPI002D7ECA6E|nr:ATP-binding cassette domain-containing protein [Leucobacter sp. M11]MEB4616200.1 ATP-binding cassette domain-containing protein [Leucobacter sp. M11]
MIAVDNVTKRHGSIVSVNEVSFTADAGVVTGLLGPNGAGKSSIMRIICDLDRADSGTATVSGRRFREHPIPMLAVGAQFEGAGAHPSRTAIEHLRWVARTNRLPKHRVTEVLELVDLQPRDWKRRVREYSLGMQQRLGIATAMLGDPQTVIFDEPANGLDPIGIQWLRGLLTELAREGKTVLLSSHLMGETEMIADRVVLMDRARVIGRGAVADLVTEHGSLEQAFFSRLEASRDGTATAGGGQP